ncbi:MAG: HAD family hydrolase [Ndongobacter sp.]|nr:HAD family hydrolase [Ndongobacter sp.]
MITLYLFATDYDNTLCRNNLIDDATRQTIQVFRENHLFGIVTGRTPESIREELEKWSVDVDFIVSASGAVIDIEGVRRKTYYIPVDTVDEVTHFLTSSPELTHAYLFSDEGCAPIREIGPFVHPTIRTVPLSSVDRRHIFGFGGIRLHKETGFRSSAEIGALFSERFGDRLNVHINRRFIDLSPGSVDKSTGVRFLADHWMIPEQNVFTFGDGGNDLPMLSDFQGARVPDASAELVRWISRTFPDVKAYLQFLLDC